MRLLQITRVRQNEIFHLRGRQQHIEHGRRLERHTTTGITYENSSSATNVETDSPLVKAIKRCPPATPYSDSSPTLSLGLPSAWPSNRNPRAKATYRACHVLLQRFATEDGVPLHGLLPRQTALPQRHRRRLQSTSYQLLHLST